MDNATTSAAPDVDTSSAARGILCLLILAIAFALMGRAGAKLANSDDQVDDDAPPPPPDHGNGGHHGIEPEWIEAAARAKRARADADAAEPGDPSAL